jgi:hypothetical protein
MRPTNFRDKVPPPLKGVLRRVKSAVRRPPRFTSSANYWEQRYSRGGTSGAGSYNRLAEFKAKVLNAFVADRNISSVIEFGSGDGAQLRLADYPSYIGVDVSPTALSATRELFGGSPHIRFLHTTEVSQDDRAELALSLDVIYHLVEDGVFEAYMAKLFESATKYVIVYASNEDRPWPDPHVRHRKFTQWVDDNAKDFRLVETVPNAYPYSADDPERTSFADFYIFERTG